LDDIKGISGVPSLKTGGGDAVPPKLEANRTLSGYGVGTVSPPSKFLQHMKPSIRECRHLNRPVEVITIPDRLDHFEDLTPDYTAEDLEMFRSTTAEDLEMFRSTTAEDLEMFRSTTAEELEAHKNF